MSLKQQIAEQLEGLTEPELEEIAKYLAFLKYRARRQSIALPSETELAALYAESGDEDSMLAEQGMEDYAVGLAKEDEA